MLFDKLRRMGVSILIGLTVGLLLSHIVRRNEPDHKHFLVALERAIGVERVIRDRLQGAHRRAQRDGAE